MSRSRSIRRPEDAIQKAVFQHIRARGVKGMVVWHTPNGGKRRPIEAAIFKSMGVRVGVSDIIAVHQGKIYALELKADGGRPTETQLEFLADMEKAGAYTALATGLDRALATLEAWGLLRGSTLKDVLRLNAERMERRDDNHAEELATAVADLNDELART